MGTSGTKQLVNFADKLFKKDLGGAFEEIASVIKSGKNIAVFSKECTVHFRNLLVVKTSKKAKEILNVQDEDFALLESQANEIDEKSLMFYMKTFSEIESELKYALSPRTLVEVAVVKCVEDFELKKNEF